VQQKRSVATTTDQNSQQLCSDAMGTATQPNYQEVSVGTVLQNYGQVPMDLFLAARETFVFDVSCAVSVNFFGVVGC